MSHMQTKVLYFNPYSGILEHLKIEKDLHRVARNSKMSVDFLRCDGFYSEFCTVMSAMSLNPKSSHTEKKDVCTRCKSLDSFSRDLKKSNYLVIDHLISPEIEQQVSRLMSKIDVDNWMDFELNGVFFGRVASYEFLLRHKLSSPVVPLELWVELRKEIESTLTTYLTAYDFLRSSNYKMVGVYNFLYGMNRAFSLAAEHLGIRTFSVQGNGYVQSLHSRYLIYDTNSRFWYLNSSSDWTTAREYPIAPWQILQVYRHFRALFKAKSVWVYSTPKLSIGRAKIRSLLGIPRNKKIYLLTTSSADEQFAFNFVGFIPEASKATNRVFQDNFDWIKETVEIFKRNPEKILVIRIHPREFANKREGLNSKEGSAIVNFLRDMELPNNIIVNVPKDEISLYDLANITEMLINSTSTVGLEFAALGIPSISVSPELLTAYPPELSLLIKSKKDYEELLTSRLNRDHFFNVKMAFRWMNFRYGRCTVAIPLRYLVLDRFFFGPFMRFTVKYPKGKVILSDSFVLLERMFEALDRRYFCLFQTKAKTSPNLGNKHIENLTIRLVSRFLKS